VKTGRREQVSKMSRQGPIEQVLPREESNPGKASFCAACSDARSEA
jgi:hypothetical protein